MPRQHTTLTRSRSLPMLENGRTAELRRALVQRLQGEVRFDDGSRALYSTDASNYRHLPIGVVIPRTIHDVVTAIAVCREFDTPVTNRGGGTSLAGQAANAAIVIDFSKYLTGIVELDPEGRHAVVEPGLVLDELRDRAEQFNLTFGPDPATHDRCTLGGMIGNNSCGVHSVMAGCTASNIDELEILTFDGLQCTVGLTTDETVRRAEQTDGGEMDLLRRLTGFRDRYENAIRDGFPTLPRRVSGYNLPALLPENGFQVAQSLVGSEGTLVTVLRARVRLVPSPPHRVLVVLGYPDVFDAADHVVEVLAAKPIGLEGMDDVLVDAMKRKGLHPRGVEVLPPGKGWLLVEMGADTPGEARDKASDLANRLTSDRHRVTAKVLGPDEARIAWRVRESGLGATARVPGEGDTWEGWEDSAVAPERLGAYLRDLRALLDRYRFHASLYGHFGDGCVHTRIPFDLRSAEGIATFRRFVEEAADLVVRHGGSLSGEHGDGQSRAELLPKMFPLELIRAFEEFKAIWDPRGRMNPGKLVNAHRLDEDLRLGAEYHRPELATHFRFPEDQGSFAYATERCVGVGECRRQDHGTMCPSYMVTREEAHSTRGRAHLLFETMRGGLPEGWRSDAVREALDLCLSCKGCKSDCPVNVDVATYKAEFLSHYYQGRLRPRSAYFFGLVSRWARVGSVAPRLANWFLAAPLLSPTLKRAAGISKHRSFPQLARKTFRDRWRTRAVPDEKAPKVLLWVDTFNNHWQPSVLDAAADVLADAGFRVMITERQVCCGRPLYDYGMLQRAGRMLRDVLDAVRPLLREGIPIVGVEPSCVAVFRDELVNLFPDDADAQRLKAQSFMLDEFLEKHARHWTVPQVGRKALVHGHCHQKAIMTVRGELSVLERAGVEAEELDAGCCGMAGGFGYERDHYDVSVACGERRLLPAVRLAPDDVLVIADGYSCREQIRQQTGREALHFAQVLQMGFKRTIVA
jgi:FAD/FMN-containing dehydrogenase/Fe-S oxidoreductase